MPPPPTFLILSQVYVPDPASVGQHIADAAEELVRRGWRVRVYTSANGYDDPSTKYPRRENLRGVDVVRLRFSSFGKSSIAVRLLAQWLFLAQAFLRGLFTRKLAAVMVSTSPPFCGLAGAWISRLRGVPVKYWLMDLNPDQMIALGKVKPNSLSVRIFDTFNRAILRRASDVVVLDRFMLDRANRKTDITAKAAILPPWPHEEEVADLPHDQNPFRTAHNLDGKFVVMYSGNHSPANPISTILDAADKLRDVPNLVFMFIGGGGAKKDVEARIAAGAANIISLPYQPLDQLRFSLSAADAHVVSIGDAVVGIVHPCKVYGAMAMSRPIILLGPTPCHVSDLIDQHKVGAHIAHGDVQGAAEAIRSLMASAPEDLRAMGRRAGNTIATSLSKRSLMARFCDILERGLTTKRSSATAHADTSSHKSAAA